MVLLDNLEYNIFMNKYVARALLSPLLLLGVVLFSPILVVGGLVLFAQWLVDEAEL